MIIALLSFIGLSLILLTVLIKAKGDVSFLEGKALDFLDREKRLINQIDDLKMQLVHASHHSYRHPVSTSIGPELHESDSLIPPEETSSDLYHHVDYQRPRDLENVELGNVTMAFLAKVGIKTFEAEIAAEQEEIDSLEQINFFEEIEVAHISSVPSLENAGLHYWEGNILQKFSEDFALISNGTYQYHLSHNKLQYFQNGDNVCLQVLVAEAGVREVLMLWEPNEIAVSA
ncbi:hypothetical protein [Paenibacillus periandrae]|uniref:hypothetical protein n=1 Tax=Paenibacillus periandrae TaxID=1761741 RepID=UPI001F0957F0|nr:hypothetical protein [Paenibacillus periandrae]